MQRVSNKRTMLSPTIRSITYETSKGSKEEGLGSHDPDVINVIFDVVYEGVNDNGDRFTEAALRGAFQTMKNKPINWEHEEPNIGVITETWLEEANAAEPLHVAARGTLWAWEYPEYADLLIASAQLGQMGFAEAAQYGPSMEVYFKDADYIIGDYERVVPMNQDTENLGARVGTLYGGKAVSRELKDIFFSGVGMTATPAEKKVKFLAVATNRSRMNGQELFKGLEDTQFALPSLRMFPIDSKEHVVASMEYFDKVAATLRDADPAQVVEALERIKMSAKAFELHMPEIIHVSSSPSASEDNCMGEIQDGTCLDNEQVKEEREETMEDTKVVAEEVTPEEEPVVEETEAAEEVTEDAIEETEASSEESFNPESAFQKLYEMLSKLMPVEETAETAEASEDSEEVDEVTALKSRITELEASLESAKTASETAKANLVGFTRLVQLERAGITVDDSSKEARIQSLASMTEDTWKIYINDVKNVTPTDNPAELSTASLILTDDDEEAPVDEILAYRLKTRAFWQRG